MQAKTHNKKFEGNIYTRKVELVGGIELETTSCWEKRSRDGGNGIGGVGSGTLEGEIIRVVVVVVVVMVMMKMVKVSGRRRRIGGGGMAERKLEEIPDLRFGVRLGVSNGHAGAREGKRKERGLLSLRCGSLNGVVVKVVLQTRI